MCGSGGPVRWRGKRSAPCARSLVCRRWTSPPGTPQGFSLGMTWPRWKGLATQWGGPVRNCPGGNHRSPRQPIPSAVAPRQSRASASAALPAYPYPQHPLDTSVHGLHGTVPTAPEASPEPDISALQKSGNFSFAPTSFSPSLTARVEPMVYCSLRRCETVHTLLEAEAPLRGTWLSTAPAPKNHARGVV